MPIESKADAMIALREVNSNNAALQARVDRLEAENAELRKDAELYRSVNEACASIPDGMYCISIEIQIGWAGVSWYDQDGEQHEIEADDFTLSEQVDMCICQWREKYAKEKAK